MAGEFGPFQLAVDLLQGGCAMNLVIFVYPVDQVLVHINPIGCFCGYNQLAPVGEAAVVFFDHGLGGF